MRRRASAADKKAEVADEVARYVATTPGQREHEARGLAAVCALEARRCNQRSIESLLKSAADPSERDTLSAITYAPLVVAAAKRGTDGTTFDPLIIGSVAETLRIGGASTLDHIPGMTQVEATRDSNAARGKVITVTGRTSPVRREGSYTVGTLRTAAGRVHFVTPFETDVAPEAFARYRGVLVPRYASTNQSPSFVLVGAFSPQTSSRSSRNALPAQ